jgi:hypothetical protein
MNPKLPRATPLLVLLAAVCACGSEPSDSCESVTPSVALDGPAPVFDWTASCSLAALEVVPADSLDHFSWFVLADPGRNAILPPVTYGGTAVGAAVGSPVTDSLASGRQYRVRLRRTTGPAGFGLGLVGEAEFTAP